MSAGLDQLRREAHGGSLWRPDTLLGVVGMLALCGGFAIAISDALRPDPLLGWRFGLAVMAAGLLATLAGGLLHRRRFDALVRRLGVPRDEAAAIWAEDDDE